MITAIPHLRAQVETTRSHLRQHARFARRHGGRDVPWVVLQSIERRWWRILRAELKALMVAERDEMVAERDELARRMEKIGF